MNNIEVVVEAVSALHLATHKNMRLQQNKWCKTAEGNNTPAFGPLSLGKGRKRYGCCLLLCTLILVAALTTDEADMSLLAEMVFCYRGRCGALLMYIEDQSVARA